MEVPISARDSYSIGEVAELIGVSPGTVRLWEAQGLILPVRSGAERRYGPQDLERLRRIRYLRTVERLNAAAIRRELAQVDGTDGSGRSLLDGDRLRSARRAMGWTLRDAAHATGLSTSFISSVERGVAGASPTALARLNAAYAGSTVRPATARGPEVTRAGEGLMAEVDAGVRIRWLSSLVGQLEPQLYTLAKGASSSGSYEHRGEEFIYVVRGRLRLWINDVDTVLEVGDCAHFPSTLAHRWANDAQRATNVIWVTTERSIWRSRARKAAASPHDRSTGTPARDQGGSSDDGKEGASRES